MEFQLSHPGSTGEFKEPWRHTLLLSFQSLGVIFGRMSIAPMFAFGTISQSDIDSKEKMYELFSFAFWTLTIISLLKYALIVLSADDDGEGGVFALYSLLCRHAKVSLLPNDRSMLDVMGYEDQSQSKVKVDSRAKKAIEKRKISHYVILFLALFGACMTICDGVLAPSLSVLSATSGIGRSLVELSQNFSSSDTTRDHVEKVLKKDLPVGAACAILICLFTLQHCGSQKLGFLFAPIVIIWLLFSTGVGVYNIFKYDIRVIYAISPLYLWRFVRHIKSESWGLLGSILLCIGVLPSVGIGALSAREAEGRPNVSFAEKEAHKLLQPVDKTLMTMATELAEYQVCVDIFITAQSYVDIASLSVIPRTTGGQVYYYQPFSALSDSAKLFNDLKWNVTRLQGFEAVMRVRCSQGIQVQEYSGNFCKRIPTDVDLPAIDCDKTIMVTMKHDDKMQDGTECAFQCALLYTTVYGERRIRVSTLSLPCTTLLSNLFRSADLDTQFACFLKQAANDIPTSPLLQVRERVTNLCIAVLFSYRKYCATVSSSGQLILPEALKLLPLYTLALVKSVGLRNDGQIDDRSFWINYVSFLSTPLAIPLVYPRMMAIHDLDSKEMVGPLPPSVPLSSKHINDSGIYLLENGDDCLIYIGNLVDPNVLQQLFGISSVNEVPSQFVLQQFDNPLSKKLNDVVNEIRRERCSYLRLKLCTKGDKSGMAFLSYMVEDKTVIGISYVEFLVHVHRQIQGKMTEK